MENGTLKDSIARPRKVRPFDAELVRPLYNSVSMILLPS